MAAPSIFIPRKTVLAQKAPGSYRSINKSHPLARHIIAAYIFAPQYESNGYLRNLASSEWPIQIFGSPGYVMSKHNGWGWDLDGTAKYGVISGGMLSTPRHTFSVLSGYTNDSATDGMLASVYGTSGGGTDWQLWVGNAINHRAHDDGGDYDLQTHSTPQNDPFRRLDIDRANVDEAYLFTYNCATHEHKSDSRTTVFTPINIPANRKVLIGTDADALGTDGDGSLGNYMTGTINFMVFFNINVPLAVEKSLLSNPWQLFDIVSVPIQISDTQERSSIHMPRKLVRSRQPTMPTGIDASNPLNKDVKLACHFGMGRSPILHDAVKKRIIRPGGSGALGTDFEYYMRTSKYGGAHYAGHISGTNNTEFQWTNNIDQEFDTGKNWTISFLWQGMRDATAFYGCFGSYVNSGDHFGVGINNVARTCHAALQWGTTTHSSATTKTYAELLNDKGTLVTITCDDSFNRGINFYFDGVPAGSIIDFSSTRITATGKAGVLGTGQHQTGISADEGKIAFLHVSQRKWSAKEVRELHRNPWQVFEPQSAPINIGYELTATLVDGSGTPSITGLTSSSVAEIIKTVLGTPSVALVLASGTATDIQTAIGTAVLAAVTTSGVASVVNLTQEGFRWRNDDGTEGTATWRQAQDTADTAPQGQALRIRILVDAGGDTISAQATLQYKRNDEPAAEWRAV